MRITPTCVPCLLRRVIYEAELVDPERAPAAIRAALGAFAKGYTGKEVSAILATEVHRAAYEAIGTKDPYKEVKESSNEVAKGLLPRARAMVEAADDRLRAVMQVAIIGNILDFGIGMKYHGPDDLVRHFDALLEEGLGHDDTDRFRNLLAPGARVVLLTDNCGEVIFDGLLCEVLRDMGVKVTMVVKGEPILTDATMEDVMRYGIDAQVDEALDTGTFAVGIDMGRLPDKVRQRITEAALVISKGMANYESLSDEPEVRPVVHLLRTKCVPVAESLGLPKDRSVIYLQP